MMIDTAYAPQFLLENEDKEAKGHAHHVTKDRRQSWQENKNKPSSSKKFNQKGKEGKKKNACCIDLKRLKTYRTYVGDFLCCVELASRIRCSVVLRSRITTTNG